MKVVVAGKTDNCRKHLINVVVYFKDVNYFVTYKNNLYHNKNNAAEFVGNNSSNHYRTKYFWYKGKCYFQFSTNKKWKKFVKNLKREEKLKVFK